jgi:hypothetical protein
MIAQAMLFHGRCNVLEEIWKPEVGASFEVETDSQTTSCARLSETQLRQIVWSWSSITAKPAVTLVHGEMEDHA